MSDRKKKKKDKKYENNENIPPPIIEGINNLDTKGYSPIHYAILQNNYEEVNYLYENGANINNLDRKGDSPLHLAIEKLGNQGSKNWNLPTSINIIKLISLAANLDLINSKGLSVLSMLVMYTSRINYYNLDTYKRYDSINIFAQLFTIIYKYPLENITIKQLEQIIKLDNNYERRSFEIMEYIFKQVKLNSKKNKVFYLLNLLNLKDKNGLNVFLYSILYCKKKMLIFFIEEMLKNDTTKNYITKKYSIKINGIIKKLDASEFLMEFYSEIKKNKRSSDLWEIRRILSFVISSPSLLFKVMSIIPLSR